MYKVIILPLAKLDIKEAAAWYNKEQKGLGLKFTKQIREELKYIKQNPNNIAIRYNTTHTNVVNGFPYIIHFTIQKDNKQILISSVFHTSRNPDIWSKR